MMMLAVTVKIWSGWISLDLRQRLMLTTQADKIISRKTLTVWYERFSNSFYSIASPLSFIVSLTGFLKTSVPGSKWLFQNLKLCGCGKRSEIVASVSEMAAGKIKAKKKQEAQEKNPKYIFLKSHILGGWQQGCRGIGQEGGDRERAVLESL